MLVYWTTISLVRVWLCSASRRHFVTSTQIVRDSLVRSVNRTTWQSSDEKGSWQNEFFRARNYLPSPSPSGHFAFVNSSDFFLIPGRVIGSGAFGEVHLAEVDGNIINESSKLEAASRPRLSLKRDLRKASTVSVKGPIKVAVKTLKGNEIYLWFTSDWDL